MPCLRFLTVHRSGQKFLGELLKSGMPSKYIFKPWIEFLSLEGIILSSIIKSHFWNHLFYLNLIEYQDDPVSLLPRNDI